MADPRPDPRPALLLGDTHGHPQRLLRLLLNEGLVEPGGTPGRPRYWGGYQRVRDQVQVVHLGDWGDWAHPKDGDLECLLLCRAFCDVMLWGNHDRALVDAGHAFAGHDTPRAPVTGILSSMVRSGQLRLAWTDGTWLATHAGLHQVWGRQRVGFAHDDPVAFCAWINAADRRWLLNEADDEPDVDATAVRDAVGRSRGGSAPFGGILWRDADEPLYDGFPQVFGHSVQPDCTPLHVARPDGRDHWGIDIGGKHGNGPDAACGLWLPAQRIVVTRLDA